MSEPCSQNGRLVTLETILEAIRETLSEQKTLGLKTYEVLSAISEQGAQLKSLTTRVDCAEDDIQAAFKSIRRIDLLHAKECGEAEVEGKRQKFWDGVLQRAAPFALTVAIFLLWLFDKLNVGQWVTRMLKEMKG